MCFVVSSMCVEGVRGFQRFVDERASDFLHGFSCRAGDRRLELSFLKELVEFGERLDCIADDSEVVESREFAVRVCGVRCRSLIAVYERLRKQPQ